MKSLLFVLVVLAIIGHMITAKSQRVAGSSSTGIYRDMAVQYAQQYGINSDIFVRQIQQESGFHPDAVSPAGAIGIAQFMPETAASMGVDPWDVESSLDGAARLDRSYLDRYSGDYAKALAAYNAGAATRHGVDRAVDQCGDSWLSCMPAQTRNYVRIILG